MRAGPVLSVEQGGVGGRVDLYRIGDVDVELSPGHLLPQYQSEHPFYDRFLPFLCARLESGDVVVDIGANVGDTAAAIVSAKGDLRVVSVEADDEFFPILERNATRIRERFPSVALTTVKALAGSDVSGVTLVGEAGTKHAVEGGDIRSTPLTQILKDLEIGDVRLIKSDVDGYDFDVLRSCDAALDRGPMLFFECQFDTRAQYRGYLQMLSWLATAKNYKGFFLFDNYGQYIMHHRHPSGIREVIDYVARQSLQPVKTRALYYLDVLAVCEPDVGLVRDVVAAYAGRPGAGPEKPG